jgi:hypothetical protein
MLGQASRRGPTSFPLRDVFSSASKSVALQKLFCLSESRLSADLHVANQHHDFSVGGESSDNGTCDIFGNDAGLDAEPGVAGVPSLARKRGAAPI